MASPRRHRDRDHLRAVAGHVSGGRVRDHVTVHGFHDGHLGLVTSADELAPVVGRFLTARR